MTLLFLLAGCGAELPAPIIQGVTPDRGWNGEATNVVIEGQGFYPQVAYDVNQEGEPDLDRDFIAWLESPEAGRRQLSGVQLDSYSTLEASIDAGFPVGVYDLVVESPAGRLAFLEDAFTVADTRADRLSIRPESILATVNTAVPFEIELLAPDGEPVPADLEVEVRVEGDPDSAPLEATVGLGLEGQVTPPDLVVTGFLGADGRATLPLTVHRPNTVTVSVTAVDSSITGASFVQVWDPGTNYVVRLGLPHADFTAVAGEAFDLVLWLEDEFGNRIDGVPQEVFLRSACGDFNAAVPLVGETIVPVVLEEATTTDTCTEQYIEVVRAEGEGERSAPLDVSPATPATFDVSLDSFSTIRAGDDVEVRVTARDRFNNPIPGPPSALVVADSVGGTLDPVCAATGDGSAALCSATSTRAADDVVLNVTSGSVTGTSPPYTVLPDERVVSSSLEPLTDVRAGAPAVLELNLFDEWGNVLRLQDAPALVWTTDELEDCGVDGLGAGTLQIMCEMFVARSGAVVTGTFDDLVVTSDPFTIHNGAASLATLLVADDLTAGEPTNVEIEVYDAYGNPYTTPLGTALTLDASGGASWTPLLENGEASQTVSLTRAGPETLTLKQDDAILGQTEVLVRPAEVAMLDVEVTEPWAFVGDPIEVRVEAQDTFGNRTADTLDVVLASASASNVSVPLVNGAGTGWFTWAGPGLGFVVDATTLDVHGASSPMDVVADCGPSGPVPAITFGGAATGRACADPSGEPVEVALSFANSSTGGASLLRYRATQAENVASDTPSFNVPIAGVGEAIVRGLVVDTALCAAETTASVWTGPDDGQPVGSLAVLGPDTLSLGDAGAYTLADVRDCTGDIASFQQVRVRAQRGVLLGVSASGEGLELTLDGAGAGGFTVDTAGVPEGGPATVLLESRSGGARGVVDLVVSGDDQRPTLWSQTPLGNTTELVDDVVLTFSEPLLPATVMEGAFEVTGPVVAPAPTVALEGDGSQVRLTFAPPLDPTLGTWMVTATSMLRDSAGNQLDGAEAGVASDWMGPFGPLPLDADPVSCSADPSVFRPDGDDGALYEADAVTLSLTTTTPPASWWISVLDAEGLLVRRERHVPLGPVDSWSFDGRDRSGGILPDGDYTLQAQAEDGFGNRTAGCTQTVRIDNERTP